MKIGIDLGGTKTEAVVLGPTGCEISRKRLPTPQNDYSGTIDVVLTLVEEMESQVHSPCTVGVATPGALSTATGLMKNANSTWLNGHALELDLEAALQRPVRIANDANCFALSEAIDGAGADAKTVFGVILGTGVGGGLVIGKSLLVGRNAIAGEWGHNPFPCLENNELSRPECFCGKHGCVETFLSGPALVSTYQDAGGILTTAEAIANAAPDDKRAEFVLARYMNHLARALAQVINILDPEVIVLGGGLSNIESLYERVPKLWDPYIFSDQVDTALRRNHHGDSSGVRGAAWLWDDENACA